jgi:chemotaxis signal transduction protein
MTAPSNHSSSRLDARGSGTDSRSAPPHAAIESLVCFMLAQRAFALDVNLVREVVNVGAVFPVPNAAPAIVGVCSLRGATLALVDTSHLLGLPTTNSRAQALVIARRHQTLCAVTIDRVIGVARFVRSHFIVGDPDREPPEVAGFMPDERSGLLTVLNSSVVLGAIDRLRFR